MSRVPLPGPFFPPARSPRDTVFFMPPHSVILFDGVCRFCCASVNFVLRRDRQGQFRFAPLQSEAGRRLAAAHGIDATKLDSLVLVDERGKVYTRSDGTLRIMTRLGWPWRLLGVFRLVPRAARDFGYQLFARHRYGLFGKRESCLVPTDEERARFLD